MNAGDPDGAARVAAGRDIEDLRGARLIGEAREQLLREQTECTFCFTDEQGAPGAVILSFLWDGRAFWFTSVAGRAQVRALERDPRVCIVVSSAGTASSGRQMLAQQGRAVVHRDPAACDEQLVALAHRLAPADPGRFLTLLSSPGRLLIEVVPSATVATHDSRRLPGDGRGGPATSSAD